MHCVILFKKIKGVVCMNYGALHRLNYGVYILSSRSVDGRINGQIVSSVFQVSPEPLRIGVVVNKANLTYRFIEESGVFVLSILGKDAPPSLVNEFGFRSGEDVDKFKDVRWKEGITRAPIVLDHTVAYIEAKVIGKWELGRYTIFLGKLVEADVLKDEEPLGFLYYRFVKRGEVPSSSPGYVKLGEKETFISAKAEYKSYECSECGYVYDPHKGDPVNGIPPGTPFESLPGVWVCPHCGEGKDKFRPK